MTPRPETSVLMCPVCKILTYSKFELRRHLICIHLSVNDGTAAVIPHKRQIEYDLFSCSFCGLSATDLSTIKEHVRKAHSEVLEDQSKHITLAPSRAAADPASSDSEPEGHGNSLEKSSTFSSSLATTESDEANSTVWSSSTNVPKSEAPQTTVDEHLKTGGILSTSHRQRPGEPGHDWSKLIARSDKKFMCLLCRHYVYNGRTEVVFHTVTRHLLGTEIEQDLSSHGCLTDLVKRRVGHLFTGGMRIRSGVHYKDAKRVESALFRSIELHLRYRPAEAKVEPNHLKPEGATAESVGREPAGRPAAYLFSTASGSCTLSPESSSVTTRLAVDVLASQNNLYTCSGCSARFTDVRSAYTHINDELRATLPEFMRARSCPWSLSFRDEWVWCVPDRLGRQGRETKAPPPPLASHQCRRAQSESVSLAVTATDTCSTAEACRPVDRAATETLPG